MFVTTASADSAGSTAVSIPIANTQPRVNSFWQIVRGVAPPWNSKYGSCLLPSSTKSVFFGGEAATSDVWVCDPRPPARGPAPPLWTRLSVADGSPTSPPDPRLFPLMTGISANAFILAGGAGLAEPWTSFTDAYVGVVDFDANTVSWQPVSSASSGPPAGLGSGFSYESPDHAPLATTGTFMRSIEGVLVSVMPTKASVLAQVRELEPPGAQKYTLVVTVYEGEPESDAGVRASYHLVKYAPAPFTGAWPSSDLQSVRLVPLLDGFAFGYVVPRTKGTASITGVATWILWLSCTGVETGVPAIRYAWTNIGRLRNAPILRSGAALFHSRAGTPSGAFVAIYGGSALWSPRANAAEATVLSAINDQGRAILPLNVGLFTRNSDGSFSFLWQNPYERQIPPVASEQPMWDGDVMPSEAPAFQFTNIDTLTVGFVHYGGFWRSPSTNATTITVVSIPRKALVQGVATVGDVAPNGPQPVVRFYATGEAYSLLNVSSL